MRLVIRLRADFVVTAGDLVDLGGRREGQAPREVRRDGMDNCFVLIEVAGPSAVGGAISATGATWEEFPLATA